MDDHLLVEALREHDADAPGAMYDAHADRLYAYCWFQLRCRDAAQVALRDTFVVAEAHIGKLRDPDRFGPWLYALARLECARRMPPRDQAPDVPVASHDQEDVDQRIMAWQAVLALRPTSREILELRVRHQLSVPDLAAVFDVPLKDAQTALERAHAELEEALIAEILAHQGPYGCAQRARLLRERRGEFDHDLNGRLMKHAEDCSVCGAFRPRTVSAAKVYGLLPDADLAPELRLRVMSCFLDPELVGYRLFVATRVTEFTADGFPLQSKQPAGSLRTSGPRALFWLRRFRRTDSQPKTSLPEEGDSGSTGLGAYAVRVVLLLTAVALIAGGGVASIYGLFDTGQGEANNVAGPRPTVVPGASQELGSGRPSADRPDASAHLDVAPVSATFPLGSRVSSAPPTALPTPSEGPSSPSDEQRGSSAKGALAASPLFLDLAGGADGAVELRAEGGPVSWQAKTHAPLRVDPMSGHLDAGQSVIVRVHVSRQPNSHGNGIITFFPGRKQVHVTWRPGAQDPGPSPSPTPTGSGPGKPSTPPGTQRPTSPPPSRPKPPSSRPPSSDPPPSKPPSSPEPSPSAPPPSGPDPSPSTEPSSPSRSAAPGTSTTSSS
ncbi:sigma-70 family RNA polymerase sigma factor [Actinomadura sp. KC06]|uniref:RNA polymerase sigma factor n=1 Tax=Actinomadura sp. KC06 TaxID=2530369 RepID=UPI001A9E2CF6|nr:sigma-70 family RNA polymerase sigma factor [Actinomadura sp. KC06]